MLVCKIQNNVSHNVNTSPSRIQVRERISDMLHGRWPVNDDGVYSVLVACVYQKFVEELQLAVSLPRSPVEYCVHLFA